MEELARRASLSARACILWASIARCTVVTLSDARPRAYTVSLLYATMSSSTPLFETIEADEPEYEQRTSATGNINPPPTTNSGSNAARPAQQMASTPGDAESGVCPGLWP